MDAVFYHALPDAHIQAVGLDAALRGAVYGQRVKRAIVLNGDNGRAVGKDVPKEAWSGHESWRRRVVDLLGAECANIRLIASPPPPPQTHSGEEVAVFLQIAKDREIGSAFVLSSPAHLPRLLLHYVRAFRDKPEADWVRVYPLVSGSVNWHRELGGSQNKPLQNYWEYVNEEGGRLQAYIEKGWLATWEELVSYLKWRDGFK